MAFAPGLNGMKYSWIKGYNSGTNIVNTTSAGTSSITLKGADGGWYIIQCVGGGAGGQQGGFNGYVDTHGTGGGGGGNASGLILLAPGTTIDYTVGAGGATNWGAGGTSTISATDLYGNAVAITANGGVNATGGSASGGLANYTGQNGGVTNTWYGGGAGNSISAQQTTINAAGNSPGGGGAGGLGVSQSGGVGGPGWVLVQKYGW